MGLADFLPAGRTAVMGVLNVTPDSFYDGGRYVRPEDALERAKQMADEGADLIDVGGESTRPGSLGVPVEEEMERTLPVVEHIASLGLPVSIDTRKAAVARAALDAGACIVNDVSGGTFDPDMLPLVADRKVPVVLMHMRGTPQTMDTLAVYDDVVTDVRRELAERVTAARAAGCRDIFLDPGLGFAKAPQHNLELVRRIGELRADGPLVVGPSRKRFLGGQVAERLAPTMAVVAWCAERGVEVVRVHDVKEARAVVDTIARLVS